jgi:hypothetical protein
MAKRGGQPVKTGQGLNGHCFLRAFLCIHGKYQGFMAIIAFPSEIILLL